MSATVLDATAGGRHIWHPENKDNDKVVYCDMRYEAKGTIREQPGWSCEPDIQADVRALPFEDSVFDLVCFDPPHKITDSGMSQLSGVIETKYGALQAETWQSDLEGAFRELWRVLREGGTLTIKWADVNKSNEYVLQQLPRTPLYGVSRAKGKGEVSWWVFHKDRSQ